MKSIKTKSLEIRFIENDILELKYEDNIDIDKSMSTENYNAYDTLVAQMDNIKRLVVLGKNMNMTQEAKMFSKEEDKKRESKIKAQAILVSDYFHQVASAVYFKLFTPKYANKTFKSREKALEWLKSI